MFFDKKDTHYSWRSSNSHKRRKIRNRKLGITSSTITITHIPAGIVVSQIIIPGHYSKTEMKKLKLLAYTASYTKLEELVTKK